MRGGYGGSLRVVCVSYPWLQPDHPDPHGTTLKLLGAVLEKFVASRFGGEGTFAVFLDFVSLMQKDAAGQRSNAEARLFGTALGGLPELYSHPNTFILKVTSLPEGYPNGFVFPAGVHANQASYYDRGWCFCESSMGNLVKGSDKVLDLAKFSGTKEDLWQVKDECKAGRPPPLAPSRFKALLEDKSFTSKKADLATVGGLYEAAFEQRVGEAEKLDYQSLGWTDEDANVLSEALGAAKSLKYLDLRSNEIGDEGVAALAAALRDGKAPKLESIGFFGNPAGPGELLSRVAVQALKDAREGLMVY